MTKEDIQFLEDNKANFETAKVGFVRNLTLSVLKEYERIYRKYIDSSFVLTTWCGSCALDMVQRIYPVYQKAMMLQSVSIESVPEPMLEATTQTEPKKKSKRKR